MTSFVTPDFRTEHEGIQRIERAVQGARQLRHWLGGPRALAAMLLAGVVSAVVVAAEQIVGAWTDGHLLAAWVLMWAVVFAALGLMAGTARQMSVNLRSAWRAHRRAAADRANDRQVWQVALGDRRLMKELQLACLRAELEAGEAERPVMLRPYESTPLLSLSERQLFRAAKPHRLGVNQIA